VSPEFDALLEAGTAVIADVFDSLGRLPPVLDNSLVPVKEGATKFIGPAYTVSGESYLWSGGGDRAKLAAIDAMTPGVVPVWAGNDIRGVCCFGDLLGSAMLARGCAGVVVDGGIRDVAFLRSIEMPIIARYRTPAQAIGRWRVTSSQTPVHVRGALEERVSVNPGDIVVADDDGVIVLPADSLDTIVTRVIAWSKSETGARIDIRNGLPLLQALEKYGHL
jgi:4-hydroxy-4-methyl-2-oxoglutarate aldolase